MQQYLLLHYEAKSWSPVDDVLANLICKEHSLLWTRNDSCTTQSGLLLDFSRCPKLLGFCWPSVSINHIFIWAISLFKFIFFLLQFSHIHSSCVSCQCGPFMPFHICLRFILPHPHPLQPSLTHVDHVKWKRQSCFMSLYPRFPFFSTGCRHLISLRLKIDSFRP